VPKLGLDCCDHCHALAQMHYCCITGSTTLFVTVSEGSNNSVHNSLAYSIPDVMQPLRFQEYIILKGEFGIQVIWLSPVQPTA